MLKTLYHSKGTYSRKFITFWCYSFVN